MIENYLKAYSEVVEILKYMPKEDVEKIPKDMKKMFEEKEKSIAVKIFSKLEQILRRLIYVKKKCRKVMQKRCMNNLQRLIMAKKKINQWLNIRNLYLKELQMELKEFSNCSFFSL